MNKFLFNIACLYPVFTCVYADELPPGVSGAKLYIPAPTLIGGAKEAPSPSLSEVKDGIERSYVSNASLSDEDVKTVLELAQKSGITKVAKISTHYMLPTSMRREETFAHIDLYYIPSLLEKFALYLSKYV